MTIIYLSSHLDDAVLSCGGIMWEQVQQGQRVQAWTFATADPAEPLSAYAQSLHARWNDLKNPSLTRREEDKQALTSLGCGWLHLDYLDCIYRRNNETGEPLIQSDADLFPIHYQVDPVLVNKMARTLEERLNIELETHGAGIDLCVPLGVGGHIDHRNLRLAAEILGVPLFYYADFPYAAKEPAQVQASLPAGGKPVPHPISTAGVEAWQQAIACYKSQISSFWKSRDEMNQAIQEYASQPFALTLWKNTAEE